MRSSVSKGQLTQKARSDTPLCTSVQLLCQIHLVKLAMIFAIQPGEIAQPLRQCPTLPDSRPVCHCANRRTRAFRNSFAFILFQTPSARGKNQPPSFQYLPHSFVKHRGGVSNLAVNCSVRFRYTPKNPPVTPFPATDPKPPRCKSFQMNRSKKGGRGVGDAKSA